MNRKTQKLTFTSKNPNVSFSGEELEKEGDYVNAALCTENKMSATSDKKSPSFTQSFLPIAVIWVILLVIMALRIHFTSVLTAGHENLMKQTKQLETQRNNLTEQIQNMETKWSEKSVAQAQWSIDAYCPKENNNRQCKACERGWLDYQSSCYLINNPPPPEQRTWEEAQDNCRGRNSDLAVIVNEDEKRFINDYSFGNSGVNGYWIGLRVEDGRWKWINGSDLTESSSIDTPTNGHCACFVHNEEWKSVNCGDKKQWICKKKALTV
ncbi:asialoglycoprotein receptor 1-like [Thunnus albacares]|uniref:asialoglycoprotein receptor 1-like n=1 Tax=Thunnus albacares TaxID=8236 RepID=UPI001CF6B3C0|nr:asialoglycoprotein receptor 1-like [Thunnus albacares]